MLQRFLSSKPLFWIHLQHQLEKVHELPSFMHEALFYRSSWSLHWQGLKHHTRILCLHASNIEVGASIGRDSSIIRAYCASMQAISKLDGLPNISIIKSSISCVQAP